MRLIDADALLKVPNVRKVEEYDETGEFISYLAVPVEAIKEAPTIEAKPVKHAQWILDTTYPGKKKTIYFCSRCSHWQAHRKNREPSMDAMYMRFCPECGARMDGGKE